MAKSKSSASSATRKKHAKKALTAEVDDDGASTSTAPVPAQRGQKKVKKSRFEPKIKSYTPPPAAPKGAPDPVDLYLNGGADVDAELVVVLRRLGKRDEATIAKGLEGLEAWVREVIKEEQSPVEVGDEWKLEGRRDEVVSSMAVWAHHLPRLALHPSRRLRLQTLTLHTLLTSPPHRPSPLLSLTREALLADLWLDQTPYVGAWCCSAFDGDRAVRSVARRGWDSVVVLPGAAEGAEGVRLEEHAGQIVEFSAGLVLPAEEALNTDSDDPTLLKTQALLALSYLLSTLPSPLPLPEDALSFLATSDLWSLVRPEEPASLRRAMYELLGAVVERSEELLGQEGVKIVAGWVMRSCWGEDEGWAGVIAFLRRYPEAWILADEPLPAAAQDESDSESDSEPAPPALPTPTPSSFTPSPTLSLLLTHLTLSCTSHPTSYPTILLLLSTLPSSVLPCTPDALSLLFESFWAAWGGRALAVGIGAGVTATEEWATALLECVVFEAVRAGKEGEEEAARSLVEEWVGRMWRTFLGEEGDGVKVLKALRTERVAEQLANTFAKLAAREEALFRRPWEVVRVTSLVASTASLPSLSAALSAFQVPASDLLKAEAKQLSSEVVKVAVKGVEDSADGEEITALLVFIELIRSVVGDDEEVSKDLDALATKRIPSLLGSTTSPAVLDFLTHQLSATSAESRQTIWKALFVSPPPPPTLLQLIQAVEEGTLPGGLESAELDELVLEYAQGVLGDESSGVHVAQLEIVSRLLVRPKPFISLSTPVEILALVTSRLESLTRQSLFPTPPNFALLTPPITILAAYTRTPANAQKLLDTGIGAIAVFELTHLLPHSRLPEDAISFETVQAATKTWKSLVAVGGRTLVEETMARLTEYLVDPEINASSIEIVDAAASLISTLPTSTDISLTTLLPPAPTFERLSEALQLSRASPAIAILAPLVSQSDDSDDAPQRQILADAASLGSYARLVLAVLEVSSRDRAWVRKNVWILPHLLLVADVARDELAVSGSTSGMFGKEVRLDVLERIVAAADGLASYTLSSIANRLPDAWHGAAVTQLRSKTPSTETNDVLQVLESLARRGKELRDVYALRAFSTVLQATLRYTEASVADAERWLAYAQALSEGSDLARAVILAIKSVLRESPRFERYQNELASTLAGVPSLAASGKGLHLLRLLLATAPPLDAPIIFLPQQRSMFLIQRMQAWIGSDDDLDEEIHSLVAELFLHLAPIVQELSGSHWDLIFDIIESNLETASWDEQASLPALSQSCRLLEEIKDLATSNPELRLTAKGRIDKSLELVRDLFVTRPDSRERNRPRFSILEIMARLVRDIPSKLLVMGDSFDQLLRLLQDPSLAVQQSSYDLVSRIAEKHVKDLVVEAELDTESVGVIELPQELIALLSAKLPLDVLDTPDEYSKASTYLLAWLTLFRFFDNASPRIKSAYIDQLRRLDLVATSFLPSVFALLGLGDRSKAFDVTPWSVDEFYIELIDEISAVSLPVFATFVYYRSLQALPSLIRSWWEACRNRQLSMAVSTFTSRHFSPVLIAHELAHLRDPDDPAGKALRDNEDFTVKVAAGANEVKAIFVVDEQNMEIGIRLPPEFPLVGVEVKDVRKVGVTDAQWRAWLLAVQQVVSAQNGLIADALGLFKRNVSLHFEGVEACAICYSIINIIDRSLPTKGCRTCHNRFHAGCLYKWFSTSHGSSCPLCRSLF